MSGITNCPNCGGDLRPGEQVAERTLICPRCHASFPGACVDLTTPTRVLDVRRGWSGFDIALVVLTGLSVLAIVLAFILTPPPFRRRGWDWVEVAGNMSFGFITLDLLVILVCVRSLWRRARGYPPTPGARLALVGCLSVGAVVAVVIFFFVVCVAVADLK